MKEKVTFFKLVAFLAFLVLLLRLFQLQIIETKKHQGLSEGNRIRKIKVFGPRGIIFDRHGEILARNLPVFKIKEGEKEKVISREEALKLQAEGNDENLYIDFSRDYPQAEIFSHLVGFLGEVEEKEVAQYGLGAKIGQMGMEQFYNQVLRGKDGGELVEVNAQGKILRKIGIEEAVPGQDLTLAAEADLQRMAAREMLGKKGAVVATKPSTGEVLILFSSPTFDPNFFGTRRSEETIQKLISDSVNRPLLNRAISGIYPPGSTFKIVTATAGLEEGKITQNTLINDPGVIYVGAYKYSNWYFTGYGRTEGEINVIRAIKRSTDTFFYKVGELLGVDKLDQWARKFGLDKVYDLDLGGEVAGFVPSAEWKLKNKGESWFLGNTYHFAIGQGDLALTPLGVNMMSSVIANQGKLCRPQILKLNNDNQIFLCRDLGINRKTIEIVKEGMIGACSTGGTAYPFFNFLPQVACKTGTAEYVDQEGKTQTHAWFTVFAPAEAPQIVLTVLVEGGGEGSSVAAPIAREILGEYFKQ